MEVNYFGTKNWGSQIDYPSLMLCLKTGTVGLVLNNLGSAEHQQNWLKLVGWLEWDPDPDQDWLSIRLASR